MMPEYTDSTTDGIDHINIYSKGYTKLGRLLSNFTKSEFTHPIYGHFMSVEGFWYYIKLEKIAACLICVVFICFFRFIV